MKSSRAVLNKYVVLLLESQHYTLTQSIIEIVPIILKLLL